MKKKIDEYREYLEIYKKRGNGKLKLSRKKFEEYDEEMFDLCVLTNVRKLTKEEERRMQELEHLLLCD